MWLDDHVLDVVQADAGDPALLEGQVEGVMRATFGVIPRRFRP